MNRAIASPDGSGGQTPPSAPPSSEKAAAPHRVSVAALVSVSVQLVLLSAVLLQFRLENRAVLSLLALVVVAFPIHALLPLAWRPTALLWLSSVALGPVLTAPTALLLVAVGVGLILLCHLPIPWGARYVVLGLVGLALAWLRGDANLTQRLGLDAMTPLWPILGSMFMFRLLIYLYDLRHGKAKASRQRSIVQTLNYFFMLPNICFPLFPVVDSKRFRKTYYDQPADTIYRRGASWMARGVVQLLLYRLVYLHLALDPAEVYGSAQLLQYIVASFLLYLRVSGLFHLIIGMMLLFGYNLPETHQRYFLASSLSDFWRRINIYWKDFMAKVFFFPCHDRLRRLLPNLDRRWILALATAWVFFMTWLLHIYQWFWLTGSGLWSWSDGLFWLILGVLVVVNVLWESRRGARKAPRQGEPWARALRILATFIFLAVLWSMWTTESLSLWLHLWSTAPGLAPTLTGIAAVSWLLAPRIAALGSKVTRRTLSRPHRGWRHDALWILGLGLLALAGRGEMVGWIGASMPTEISSRWVPVVESLRSPALNARDAASHRQGYYEHLIAAPMQNPELHQLMTLQPADWVRIDATDAWRPTPGLRHGELVPGAQIQFKGAPLSVNRWGMRDRDYARQPSPGTERWALLGSSHSMGSGVADDGTFEHLFESRWNEEIGPLDLLNFAVAGHSAVEDMLLLDERVFDFEPDVLVEVAHTHDVGKLVRYLARTLAAGQAVDHPALTPQLAAAGATPGQARSVLEHRLRPLRWDLIASVYRHMADRCRAQGVAARWVLLPLVGEASTPQMDRLVEVARQAGFEVTDLRQVYDAVPADPEHPTGELRLAPWDDHPNALAHRVIAEALWRAWGPAGGVSDAVEPDASADETRERWTQWWID